MKKLCVLILILSVVITLFVACSDKEKALSTTTVFNSEVASSYARQSGEGKTVVFENDKNDIVKHDVYDEDGLLKYTEQCMYTDDGTLYGYSYYNSVGECLARYLFAGEKIGYFYENGDPMSEPEFSQRMEMLGVRNY